MLIQSYSTGKAFNYETPDLMLTLSQVELKRLQFHGNPTQQQSSGIKWRDIDFEVEGKLYISGLKGEGADLTGVTYIKSKGIIYYVETKCSAPDFKLLLCIVQTN